MTKPAAPDDDEKTRPARPLAVSFEAAVTEEVPLHVLLTQFVAETRKRQSQSDPGNKALDQPTVDLPRELREPQSLTIDAPFPVGSSSGDFESDATAPGMPIPVAGVEAHERRGDIEQLLAAVGPFLWSLEEAAKWVRDHGDGDPTAEAHVRALQLLARILGQLQARVDEAASAAKQGR